LFRLFLVVLGVEFGDDDECCCCCFGDFVVDGEFDFALLSAFSILFCNSKSRSFKKI